MTFIVITSTIITIMTVSKNIGTPSISAMELRSNPGTVLDRVDYKQETFIIERAGKPKAVLVPVAYYNELQRVRQNSKKEFFRMVDEIQKRTAKYNPKKIQIAIDEATNKTS